MCIRDRIQTADNVAEKYGISREDCDAFGLASQKKAIEAIDGGRFKDEIVPVYITRRTQDPLCFDTASYTPLDVYKRQGMEAENAHGDSGNNRRGSAFFRFGKQHPCDRKKT